MHLTIDQFRRLGYRAVDLAAEHLAQVPSGPVYRQMKAEDRERLMELPLPNLPAPPDQLLDFIEREILAHPMGNGHPRFFGWVNSPPAMLAILTEVLAAAMNPSCAGGDHAAIYVERCAVRWLMELIGFPAEGSMGLLVSGGSMASLTALAAARHWIVARLGGDVRAQGLGKDYPRLIIYLSDQGHSCLQKAVELLGLGSDSIRWLPTDERFRMDPQQLAVAVAKDRDAGHQPFCVCASAGTVATGAIDPLESLADYCEKESLWLHVDGAYGAVGMLDETIRSRYLGLERANSVALDPHKWLSVPVECGCVLVKDGNWLRDAFSLVPPYIRTEPGKGIGGLPWYSEYGFQQSRGFRALKLWITLQHAGKAGLSATIRRHNSLARQLEDLIRETPDLELAAEGDLSIVCFRFHPRNWTGSPERLDELNKRIMETLQAEGSVFVTNAMLRSRFALRACILHYATSEADLAALVAAVSDAGIRMLSEAAKP